MGTKRHVFDILSVLTLMMLFAFLALSVALTGTSVYSRTVKVSEKNSFMRTSALYLQQKLRRADGDCDITLARMGDGDALVLTKDYDGELYSTYIYCFEGQLMEVMTPASITPAPEGGQKLCELESFSVSIDEECSLLKFVLNGSDGEADELMVNIRSGLKPQNGR